MITLAFSIKCSIQFLTECTLHEHSVEKSLSSIACTATQYNIMHLYFLKSNVTLTELCNYSSTKLLPPPPLLEMHQHRPIYYCQADIKECGLHLHSD